MKISRLRLLGFKSFVEPTELLVEPGLTGVVGPNGCGKSNLLEALRWVMGETSYKTMRASAMDDVIFAGTAEPAIAQHGRSDHLHRQRRALRTGPVQRYRRGLEVSRRIERDAGSAFKINGRDVRARDVRLLFEDAATGARSPALVRQGRIGEIVNAKPQDRRRVLEDAAGIAGLHSRRHEAELRLRGAESNLERLQDLMGQMTTQMNSLKRQARQARRYKTISTEIRQAEALHHHLHWTSLCEQVDTSEGALNDVVRRVAQLTTAEAEALRAQGAAADTLQPLRDEETTRAAVLHRLTVERDTLDEEEARMQARQEELEERREQLQRDIGRERESISEAEEVLARLAEEHSGLAAADAGPDDAEPAARAATETLADELAEAEKNLAAVTATLADTRARRQQLEQTVAGQRQRIAAMETQRQELDTRLETLTAERGGADFTSLKDDVERLTAALESAETGALAAKAAHARAREMDSDCREEAERARLHAQELETEVQTLTKLLKPADDARWLPIVQDVSAEPGYELALGAALGDDLDASADAAAPAHWSESHAADDPALPQGAEPLGNFVRAPGQLDRRLAQVGIVEKSEGAALQATLKPGQRLVSRDGDLWRWDGYTAAAEAPTASAKRLSERNRLSELTREAETARNRAASEEKKREDTRVAATEAEEKETRAHTAWRSAQSALDEARNALGAAEQAAQDTTEEFGAISEAKKRTADALDEARATESEAQAVSANAG